MIGLCCLQLDDNEVALVRQKVIEIRQSWLKRNEEEVMKRWAFEEAVRHIASLCVHTLSGSNKQDHFCVSLTGICDDAAGK